MGLARTATVVCLLVVASALSVASGGAATGGVDDCSTTAAASDVAANGPVLTVVPDESTVSPGERGVVLVCIVNPPDNDETFDFSLVVEHDGDPGDARLWLVGPRVGLGEEPTQQVMPLDRRVEEGYGRFVSPGDLPPGTGAQYAVVLEAGAPRGDYEFEVAVVWDPLRLEDGSVLHVAGSRCGPFCRTGRAIDGVVATVAAGGAYLRTHPRALVSFVGVLVGVASVTVAILSSAWLRDRLGIDVDDEFREED